MAVAAATMAARTSRSLLARGPGASLPRLAHGFAQNGVRELRQGFRGPRRPAPMSPSDTAPRSRVRLTGTTEPLTAVHARSGPLVFDLTDGRAPRGGRCFKYRPPPGHCSARRPLLIFTPELRGAPGGQDRPSRLGPLLLP